MQVKYLDLQSYAASRIQIKKQLCADFKIQIYKQFWILAVFKLQQNFLTDHLPMN